MKNLRKSLGTLTLAMVFAGITYSGQAQADRRFDCSAEGIKEFLTVKDKFVGDYVGHGGAISAFEEAGQRASKDCGISGYSRCNTIYSESYVNCDRYLCSSQVVVVGEEISTDQNMLQIVTLMCG